MRTPCLAFCTAVCLGTAPGMAVAQPPSVATSDVFQRYADRVVKIQVVETGSAAKSGIGSGFFVSADGQLVTNYHVIAELIQSPGRYRAEYLDAQGQAHTAEVLGVDVISDLAVLSTTTRPSRFFEIAAGAVPQGTRLYSLGHPRDLGLSIVEGTYNGQLAHTRHPRIHFTGAINQGMSGGPTITEDGRVIGVNVATAGNQIGFLVPVAQVANLLGQVRNPSANPPVRTLAQVAAALRQDQDGWLGRLFVEPPKEITLGPWRVVTEPTPTFRCWADADRTRERTYESVVHSCETDDDVYLASDHSTGTVRVEHQLLTTQQMNAVRFYSLFSSTFGADGAPGGDVEHVTSWRCESRNVKHEAMRMRAVLCLRRYRKLDGLYDGQLKVAVLGRRNAGLISTMTVAGASFENLQRLTTRYLEFITWN